MRLFGVTCVVALFEWRTGSQGLSQGPLPSRGDDANLHIYPIICLRFAKVDLISQSRSLPRCLQSQWQSQCREHKRLTTPAQAPALYPLRCALFFHLSCSYAESSDSYNHLPRRLCTTLTCLGILAQQHVTCRAANPGIPRWSIKHYYAAWPDQKITVDTDGLCFVQAARFDSCKLFFILHFALPFCAECADVSKFISVSVTARVHCKAPCAKKTIEEFEAV